MTTDDILYAQLPHVLVETNFSNLGKKYQGKVRDSYSQGGRRILITTDRLSCFDRVVTAVPFKGQVLNELAVYWFKLSQEIVPNHIIDIPDPNVMLVRECEILPIEVVIRGYITGSAWRDYESGKAVSGITLPPGLRASEKLPEPLLTPSTKAEMGAHDEPISEEQILASRIVEPKLWQKAREAAFALFALGQERAGQRGLILVDTKYEFGLLDGELVLADEVHTLDSSRYWIGSSYQERFERGDAPEMLDKEPTRQWLLEQGFKGDGPIPQFTDEHRVSIARRYMDAFEKITGRGLDAKAGSVEERIRSAVSQV